jgi:hypothetical protein
MVSSGWSDVYLEPYGALWLEMEGEGKKPYFIPLTLNEWPLYSIVGVRPA